jgi:hypothetical protein
MTIPHLYSAPGEESPHLHYRGQVYRVGDFAFITPEEPGPYRIGQIRKFVERNVHVRMVGRLEQVQRRPARADEADRASFVRFVRFIPASRLVSTNLTMY